MARVSRLSGPKFNAQGLRASARDRVSTPLATAASRQVAFPVKPESA
jgi:hypothetical protein